MLRQGIYRQRFADFLKLRVRGDEPGATLDGQFGGERAGISEGVFLL
jgi:hypothetical protein